jgi:catechol 2,3-dioxygenase-like lactoylglutathione lyase family enzyme
MLGSSSIMAFVSTKDPARAKTFYQDVLGLNFVADEPYALVFEANGTMLRVSKVREISPAPYTVLGWKVTDINTTIGELTARGVTFERFPGFPQDDLGIMTFPEGAKVAWFKDPDGNMLSLTQFS